jgi:(p)ppGpp synthase/HD superfamily hydrolase
MANLLNPIALTSRFDEAFRYAHQLHQSQTRKGTDIPYISHLMTVSALVVEHGGNEDQAIAGLLHDAAEDQGGAPRLAEIRTKFGDAVADTVAGDHATLATKRTLPLTWAGLAPAGSHQLCLAH